MSLSADFPTTRPSLLLDFVNTQALDPRITFTRASSATYFDAAGVLQTAPAGQARFDYNPSTFAPLGLLIEEQRVNSIRNNTMQGAVAGTPGTLPTNWTVTAISNLTTNVIGTGTAAGITWIDVQIVGTSSSTLYQLSFDGNTAIAASATQAWTGSFWVAQIAGTTSNINSTNVRVAARDSGGSTLSVNDSAAITLSSALTRYSSTFASLPVNSAFVQESLRLSITNGAAIDITLRIGLPQLELGAFATSVIPTTTTAVTRNAEVASMTGVDFSSWYNQAEGTVVCIAQRYALIPSTAFANLWAISDNTVNERYLVYNTGAGQTIDAVITDGGTPQATLLPPGAIIANTPINTALAYKVNDFAMVRNSGTVATDTNGTLPTVDRFYIGANHLGGGQWTGYICKLAYYPFRLTNSQLQALTS